MSAALKVVTKEAKAPGIPFLRTLALVAGLSNEDERMAVRNALFEDFLSINRGEAIASGYDAQFRKYGSEHRRLVDMLESANALLSRYRERVKYLERSQFADPMSKQQ